MAIPGDKLRIIDANLNRIGEGLRVLEEFARLSLNDTALTQQLKNMRHELLGIDLMLQEQLLQARDAGGDVGADMEVPGEDSQRDVSAAVVANSRRVQESLRVLEELAKNPGIPLNSNTYRQARFSLYTVEKELLSRMLRKEKLERMTGLYAIIDTAALRGRSHMEAAAGAIRGGAKVIQLRDKEHDKKELLSIAEGLKKLCLEHNILFIVNDSLEIALASDADGLHIGEEDLPAAVARSLLPIDKILGCSARTVETAQVAKDAGADYIGVGAMYPTSTKEAAEVVGTERLKEIRKAVDLPIVAIGGINKDNAGKVMKAGACAVAVINALLGADDIKNAARQLVEAIEGKHGK